MTAAEVSESRDANRPRSIDYRRERAGRADPHADHPRAEQGQRLGLDVSVPRSAAWRWPSSRASRSSPWRTRVAVPMLDLALLRNRVLVGSTVAILIGAGTINALMYLLSLYFQDPATLGLSPLQAGLATLPATAGLVAIAPFVPRVAARFGGRQVVGAGFAITAVGFAVVGLRRRLVAVRRIRPAADRRRRRDGTLQRAGDVGVDRMRLGGPGRGGLRRLQHGALRRRGRGDGAGRDDLRQRHR